MTKLNDAREKINKIDEEIAKLFEERFIAVKDVLDYKIENGLSIEDLKREEEIIKRNSNYINDDLIKEHYVNFFKNLLKESKEYQRRLSSKSKIAYSGVKGAYAYLASEKLFDGANLINYSSFEKAYNSVVKGECDTCVLPIENSYAGEVGEVMDLIFSGPLYINQITELDVSHVLIGVKGASLSDIKVVISHPQALAQCDDFIKEYKLETKEASNTAKAAYDLSISKDKTIGVIASKETAKLYNLDILKENISTQRSNTTRFASFSRSLRDDKVKASEKNFIIVFTVKNESGSLARSLNIIGAHNFNMRNLRSRPLKSEIWKYYFYVEIEGDVDSIDGKDMLHELKSVCDNLKLVGIYLKED
ncbi:MAG: chorismate mutase [Gammaproteobacteria bacterium]|nr:chorismate mutase [Gammaproteobacteria bacterium]